MVLFILMINYTVSLVRESDYSAMSHFKMALRVSKMAIKLGLNSL